MSAPSPLGSVPPAQSTKTGPTFADAPSPHATRITAIAIPNFKERPSLLHLNPEPFKNVSAWYGDNLAEKIVLGFFSCIFILPIIVKRYLTFSKVKESGLELNDTDLPRRRAKLEEIDKILSSTWATRNSKEHLQIKLEMAKLDFLEGNYANAHHVFKEIKDLNSSAEANLWYHRALALEAISNEELPLNVRYQRIAFAKEAESSKNPDSESFLKAYDSAQKYIIEQITKRLSGEECNDAELEVLIRVKPENINITVDQFIRIAEQGLTKPNLGHYDYVHSVAAPRPGDRRFDDGTTFKDPEFERNMNSRQNLRHVCFLKARDQARTVEDTLKLAKFCKTIGLYAIQYEVKSYYDTDWGYQHSSRPFESYGKQYLKWHEELEKEIETMSKTHPAG